MTECFYCSKQERELVLTWFYTEEKLVKKPLCRKCIDDEEVDFYGPKDMYTADEVIRRLRHILNEKLGYSKEFGPLQSADIMKKGVKVFKPTLEEDEVELNE